MLMSSSGGAHEKLIRRKIYLSADNYSRFTCMVFPKAIPLERISLSLTRSRLQSYVKKMAKQIQNNRPSSLFSLFPQQPNPHQQYFMARAIYSDRASISLRLRFSLNSDVLIAMLPSSAHPLVTRRFARPFL